MHFIRRRRRGRIALGVLALLALAGGAAYASIPDAAGVVHGCYRTSTDDQKGQLRVVEDPASCRSNESPIHWNQQGETGPPGPPGPPGEDGQDGAPFSGTFTSPNGQFSLSVTDTGIELAGAGSSITLDAGGIEVRGATAVNVLGGSSVRVAGAATVEVEAGGSATVDAGSTLSLGGAFVEVAPGAGCRPAARIADAVNGVAVSGVVSGTITSGSTTVCIG